MSDLRAVIFDWRGTLVTGLEPLDWVRHALHLLGRDDQPDAIASVWDAISAAAGDPDRLDAPGVDSDATRHRDTYYRVFADAGLDDALADALYAVESDSAHNRFAEEVPGVLHTLAEHGCRIAVLSDIHFDLRPAFAATGLQDLVDLFVLSYEHGVQKPDPAIFELALDGLRSAAAETLMVGDRASHDGAAVELGMPVLLVPPLTDVTQRRLHLVESMVVARD